MKGHVVGNINSLNARQKSELQKLASKRLDSSRFQDVEVAKKAASLSAEFGLMIALLVGRDGYLTHVVVGSKDRLYLPELGRFRLDSARLRRVRLLVFYPSSDESLDEYYQDRIVYRTGSQQEVETNLSERRVLAPVISPDFLTDLEKLRFDALIVNYVDQKGELGALSLAHLEKLDQAKGSVAHRALHFLHFKSAFDLEIDFDGFIADLESRLISTQTRTYKTDQELAVLVGAYTSSRDESERSMAELCELAESAGIAVVDTVMQRRRKLDPKTVIGKGKVEEVTLHCLDLGADLVIFDKELSPGQLRAITNETELRVIDRSMLILDIFAQRAVSSEGRLQVELAQLKYSLPRLTEQDSGLSRLTGGIGGRGPGETKLEIGRRRARKRIADLEKRLQKVSDQRALRRSRRQSRGVPVVALVGYTNAGKSTLLNALTNAEVLVEDKLFATLDLTSRRMRFPNEKEVLFVDTVGFIRELPKELVTAFRATLEEIGEADLLIHVQDATNPDLFQQKEIVETTIKDLGFSDTPLIYVLNKTDCLTDIELKSLVSSTSGLPVSALKREGFKELIEQVQEILSESFSGADPGQFIPSEFS